MKSSDQHLPGHWHPGRRQGAAVALALAALAAAAAVAVGCGSASSSSSAGAPQGSSTTSIQVLATVQRGDIAQSVTGSAKLATSNGKTVAFVQVTQQNAASVAIGQKATVMVFRPRSGGQGYPQPNQSGMPQPGQSGMPQPGQSGMPQPGQSGMPQPGQSGFPGGQDGQGGFNGGGFGGNAFGGRGTAGTVTKVMSNADGSATVKVTLSKKPANSSAASTGFASIQTKVLAADVLIIPTAAIKGSGSSATVQVLSSGKTSTVSVEVGQQSGGESEIVSGLSEGQNVVYTRSFPRGAFPGNGNGPAPGQSGAPFPPGAQSGGQSNGGSL
jgi:hypothetical protein